MYKSKSNTKLIVLLMVTLALALTVCFSVSANASEEVKLNPKQEPITEVQINQEKGTDLLQDEVATKDTVTELGIENKAGSDNAIDYHGKIVILHTNDVHGSLNGYAKLKYLKSELEEKGAKVIIADAGDYFTGSLYTSLTKGAVASDVMSMIGYDVVTVGSNDFGNGQNSLKQNLAKLEASGTKVVCSNIISNDTGQSLFDNIAIIEKDGVKIGFYGVSSPDLQTYGNPTFTKGLHVLTNNTSPRIFEDAKTQIQKLKNEGADVIIALSHLGVDDISAPYKSYNLLENVDGIDFVIDGHSHTVMPYDGEHLIQQAGTAFSNIGLVVVDSDSKQIDQSLTRLMEISDIESDPDTEAKIQQITDELDAQFATPFAYSEVKLNGDKAPGNRNMETNNGDLITDALFWKAQNIPFAEDIPNSNLVAITNGGGIRAGLKIGEFSRQDIHTILPFGNTLALITVKGADLLEALEASTYCTPDSLGGFPQVAGIDYSINTCEAYDPRPEPYYPGSTYYGPKSIKRVTINSINGVPFDPEATYKVATNDFIASGGDTYYVFSQSPVYCDAGITLEDTVVDYIIGPLNRVIGKNYENPQGRTHTIDTEHEVTFMDGAEVYKTIKVGDGLKVQQPEDPKKTGYVFDGWYTDEECTNSYDFDTLVTEDLTLYAKWNAQIPEISSVEVSSEETYTYTGEQIKPKSVIVKDSKNKEIDPAFYDLTYGENINAGVDAGSVTAIAKEGKAIGEATGTFTIKKLPVNIPTADVTKFVYNGKEQVYKIDDSPYYAVLNNHQTYAGRYTVSASLVDQDNTIWSDNTSADQVYDFVISKADVPKEEKTGTGIIKVNKGSVCEVIITTRESSEFGDPSTKKEGVKTEIISQSDGTAILKLTTTEDLQLDDPDFEISVPVESDNYAYTFIATISIDSQHQHELIEIPEAPATQKTSGHKAYFQCNLCHKYYEDQAASKEITNLEEWLDGDGKTEDSWEVQFDTFKSQQIAILKAMKKSTDSQAVTDLIDKAIKDVEESAYIDGVDLNQNKSKIAMMVEDTQKAVDKQRTEDEKKSQEEAHGSGAESGSAQTGDMTYVIVSSLMFCVLAAGFLAMYKRREL